MIAVILILVVFFGYNSLLNKFNSQRERKKINEKKREREKFEEKQEHFRTKRRIHGIDNPTNNFVLYYSYSPYSILFSYSNKKFTFFFLIFFCCFVSYSYIYRIRINWSEYLSIYLDKFSIYIINFATRLYRKCIINNFPYVFKNKIKRFCSIFFLFYLSIYLFLLLR